MLGFAGFPQFGVSPHGFWGKQKGVNPQILIPPSSGVSTHIPHPSVRQHGSSLVQPEVIEQ